MAAKPKRSSRRIHVAKNKKKAWRKTDVKDTEDFLASEKNQEQYLGDNTKKNNIFFIDKNLPLIKHEANGNQHLQQSHLRCFANLEPDPKIKPALIPPNHRIKLRTACLNTLRKKQDNGSKSVKRAVVAKTKRKKATNQVSFDLWGNDLNLMPEKDVDPYYLRQTKKMRVHIPISYNKKTSELPSVELPHPGASYNPTYFHHQELLNQVNSIEMEKEKAENKLYNTLIAKFPDHAPSQKAWLDEMSAGLFDKADENDMVEEEMQSVAVVPKLSRPRTRQQRRRAAKKKLEDFKRKAEKLYKRRENEVYRIHSLKKDIKEMKEKTMIRKQQKKKLAEKKKTEPKILGKLNYEPSEIEVKLSEELTDSLRLLKPEGHLIIDRFKSLQRRNILEPRIRQKFVRKYKLKNYEKRSHKEIEWKEALKVHKEC